MISPEQAREIEMAAEKQCVEWLYAQLIELAGFDFDEQTEILPVARQYLLDNNKKAIELTQEDKENIYSDILIPYLDSLVR